MLLWVVYFICRNIFFLNFLEIVKLVQIYSLQDEIRDELVLLFSAFPVSQPNQCCFFPTNCFDMAKSSRRFRHQQQYCGVGTLEKLEKGEKMEGLLCSRVIPAIWVIHTTIMVYIPSRMFFCRATGARYNYTVFMPVSRSYKLFRND